MKKNDFDNRLQNDLFPQMPRSFERKLKQAMDSEGVQAKKRSGAAGIFAASVSVLAAAACLVIVLIGVLSGGRSDRNQAAAPGETAAFTEAPQTTPKHDPSWKWDTKVITLSTGFEFENQEKFETLYKGILRFLMIQGESEPDELWLCGIKSRFVSADTGDRSDGYLSGYYVLAQHTFGEKNGAPELYCLSEDLEVLWATVGSASGPNHAVHPLEDSYAEILQRHFIYGTEPFIPEPGVPHVKRGVMVGAEPGTDIEFSMFASISEVQDRLTAANSAYIGFAREYFLVTVSAGDWDSVMANPILRFETLEGPVDVDMKTKLPEAKVVLASQPSSDTELVKEVLQGVEQWLSQNQPIIRDFTDDWCGEDVVQQYAEAVRRALLTSGEHIQDEIWICAIAYDWENKDGTPPEDAYVLAWNVSDGETSPELFYYQDGRIVWRTAGADVGRVNVVYHNGNTIVFGKSPAFDGEPLAMSYGKIVLKDGSDQVAPALALDEIRQRITGGPHYDAARECFLWMDGAEHEVKKLTIAARIDGKDREYTLDEMNVLTPQTVPAMAVESDAGVFPGTCTHFDNSLYVSAKGENYYSGGDEVIVTLEKLLDHPEQVPEIQAGSENSRRVITRSDTVEVQAVRVFTDRLEDVILSWENKQAMELPQGNYYVCYLYRDTTPDEKYVPGSGQRKYVEEWAIYRVRVTESVTPALASPYGRYTADMLPEYSDSEQVDETGFKKVAMAYGGYSISFIPANENQALQKVLVYDASGTMFLQESEGISLLSKLPCGSYCVVLLTSSAEDGAANAFGIGLSIVPPLIVETERDLVRGTLTEDYQSLDQNGVSASGEPTLSLVEKAYQMYEADPKSVPSFTLEPGGWFTQPEEGIVLRGVDVYDVVDQAQRAGGGAADSPVELYGVNMETKELNDLPAGVYFLCFHAKWEGKEDPDSGITPFETRLVIFRVTVK